MHTRSALVLANLVNRFDRDVAEMGDTVHIPFDTELVANDKVQGVSTSPQNPTDTEVQLLIDQHKESTAVVPDVVMMEAHSDLRSHYQKNQAYAIAKAVDTSLANLATGFSQSVGTYNTAITTDTLLDGIETLDLADVPEEGRAFVFRADVKRDLLDISTYTSRDFVSGGPVESGKLAGELYGVKTFMSNNLAITGSNTSNMLFQRDALALGIQKSPRSQAFYNGDHLEWRTTVDVKYGVLEVRDNFGIEVRT